MAQTLILQEDGRYSIWSTIVDYIIETDLTKEEVYKLKEDIAVEQARKDSKANVDYLFSKIGKSKHVPNSMQEAKLTMKEIHGDDKV